MKSSTRTHNKLLILLIGLCLVTAGLLKAQSTSVGFVAGANLANQQIDDFFHNVSISSGINAGLVSKLKISEKWAASLELLISQNGKYLKPESYPMMNYREIKTTFAETPFYQLF